MPGEVNVDELEARVVKGIEWLTAHDTTGAFHLWYESRISPRSTMPAQPPEVKAAYAEYHQARALWEDLWSRFQRAIARQEKEAS